MSNIRNGRPQTVARFETLKMETCRFCSGPVRQKPNSAHKARVVFRLETDRITAIRYMRPRYYCERCKREMLPEMDGLVPKTKFDREILVMLALLHRDRGLSYREIASFMSISFGIKLAPATVYNSIRIVERVARVAACASVAGQF